MRSKKDKKNVLVNRCQLPDLILLRLKENKNKNISTWIHTYKNRSVMH